MNNTVPEGWQVRSIGDLVTLQYGKSPKEVMAEDGQYPVIGTGGVTGYSSSYLYDGCTTVIGRKGTINKPSYVEGKFWAIDTTYFGTGYKEAEPKWFYYSLNSFDLSKYNEASGVPSLGRDTLNAIPLLTPPLPEQQKIAAILSSVDDVIEKTRAQIDKLKDLKTGMMQELLTKGIGHKEFKNSPVGRIPKEWNVSIQGEVATFFNGRAYKLSEWEREGTPVIRLQNLTGSGTDFYYSTMQLPAKQYCEKGDLLYMWSATFGPHIWHGPKAIFHYHIWKVVADETNITKTYLYYLLEFKTRQWKEQSTNGMGILHVTKGAMEGMELALPPLAEQHRIAQILDSVDSKLDALIRKLSLVSNTKKALMQDLLTGKVRVKIDQKESAVA